MKKKMVSMILALICVLGAVSCGSNTEEPGYRNPVRELPPILMVHGKLYHWAGMSKEFRLNEAGEVYTVGDASTVLPDGYVAAGEISGITGETPTEERQLRAAFEAEGTIFTNDKTPEVVYVLMDTSWFDDYYIRFVREELHDNECIFYQGRQYRISMDTEICEIIEELPEACMPVGTLAYIGNDVLPQNDLETNCVADGYSRPLDGREAFMDPNDSSILYVYEHQYRAQEEYPAWRVCRLWAE